MGSGGQRPPPPLTSNARRKWIPPAPRFSPAAKTLVRRKSAAPPCGAPCLTVIYTVSMFQNERTSSWMSFRFGFRRPEAASILNFKMLGGSEFRLRNSPPPLTALNLRRIRGVGQKAGFVVLRHRSFLPTQHTSEQSPLCSDAFLRTLRIGGRRYFNARGGEKSFPLCAQRGPTDLASKIIYSI